MNTFNQIQNRLIFKITSNQQYRTLTISFFHVCRYSVVGIATVYGVEGPGFEPRWGWDFPRPSGQFSSQTQAPMWWVLCLSRGNVAGRCFDHPSTSTAEGEGKVEVHLFPSPPLMSLWQVRANFTVNLIFIKSDVWLTVRRNSAWIRKTN